MGGPIGTSRGDREEVPLLTALYDATGPIGARQIRESLRLHGIELSESTIARRLRELDSDGLTQQVGLKGRTLTTLGRHRIGVLLRADRTATDLRHATQVETAEDVLNLLKARRAIEPEAVFESAHLVTPHDIASLGGLVTDHDAAVGAGDSFPRDLALGFHRRVTAHSENPLVQAMLAIVLDPSLDRVEAALDVILEVRHRDRDSVAEHQAIVEALAAHDGALAAELMRSHLSRLIAEVEAFIERYDGALLERLIRWNGRGVEQDAGWSPQPH
ncbi:FCD domain-containing protein [Saccharopolyspora spinosa]|uniref:FCD domain-containing protein n=1 Tax=Saccharopolyspora spinosa TaxID=60894 RepID=UPI000237A57C